MKYYSLNKTAPNVSFQEAVIKGLAPDKGLYFPKEILKLEDTFFENIENLSNSKIAFEVIHQFVGNEIPDNVLKEIIAQSKCSERRHGPGLVTRSPQHEALGAGY